MTYTKYMHGICHTYTTGRCSDLSVLTGFKAAINVRWNVNTCAQHDISGQQLDSTQKAWFIVRQDIPGIFPVYTTHTSFIEKLNRGRQSASIYHVYTMHIPWDGHLRARLVAQPRLEASDRDFRRSNSVFATERSPTRGGAAGTPKFHNQVLIS